MGRKIAEMPERWQVPATMKHALLIYRDLRSDIVEEVRASGGYTAKGACEAALRNSTYSWAGYLHGELAVLYGIMEATSPSFGNFAVPWALTGNVVAKYPFAYWKASVEVVVDLRKRFPYMINMVDARREYALNWLKRLGFKIGDPEPWGKFQLPFCKIEMRSLCVSP